jgi:organic radical activating enzyme
MIEVSEMYVAPQGEGPNMGRLSLFVRLRRCTLRCVWCDTKQTWDKGDPDYEKYETYEPHQLASAMLKKGQPFGRLSSLDVQAIVLTGGEPLMWQEEMVEALISYRSTHGIPVEVETSGTIVPNTDMLMNCSFTVSHKLASSHNEGILRDYLWNEKVVQRIIAHSGQSLRNVNFKPVVDPVQDVVEVASYLNWLNNISDRLGIPWSFMREHIYLMPQGTSALELSANQAPIIEMAQAYGVRCTTRMHIIAYGDERGR